MSEAAANARHKQGQALARHLKVKPGTKRHRAIVYGTKRAYGWRPSREKKIAPRAERIRRVRKGYLASGKKGIANTTRLFGGTRTEAIAGNALKKRMHKKR
jgi:hypothetical protein